MNLLLVIYRLHHQISLRTLSDHLHCIALNYTLSPVNGQASESGISLINWTELWLSGKL